MHVWPILRASAKLLVLSFAWTLKSNGRKCTYRQAADAGASMGLTKVYLLFHAPTSGKREWQVVHEH